MRVAANSDYTLLWLETWIYFRIVSQKIHQK